jgi:hypothetical protein
MDLLTQLTARIFRTYGVSRSKPGRAKTPLEPPAYTVAWLIVEPLGLSFLAGKNAAFLELSEALPL